MKNITLKKEVEELKKKVAELEKKPAFDKDELKKVIAETILNAAKFSFQDYHSKNQP